MNVMQDLRQAGREMRTRPGFTMVIVLSLALGIGANSSIFTIADAVLLRSLPFAEEDQLVRIRDRKLQAGKEPRLVSMTLRNAFAIQEQNEVFTDVGVQHIQGFSLTGGEEPEQVRAGRITHNALSVLGVEPILGRGFLPEEDQPGAGSRAVLLGYALWNRRFGADPNVLGESILLDDESYLVVGVLPQGYTYPYDSDLWVPGGFDPHGERAATYHLYNVFARLKPNVAIEMAQAELDTIDRRLAEEFPDTNSGCNFFAMPLREDLIEEIRPQALLALLAAAGCLLLIGCANVTSMLLARSLEQGGELAMRSVLGANRLQLLRQYLIQGLLLAILSGGVALLLTQLTLRPVVAMSPVMDLSSLFHNITIDFRAVGFTLVLSVVVGCIFSLIPALKVSRPDLQHLIKEGSRGTPGRGGRGLLSVVVIFELAVTVVLLIAASLMLRSIWNLQQVDPGYDPKNVLTMRSPLSETKYPTEEQRVRFLSQVLEQIEALPEVTAADMTSIYPLQDVRFVTTIYLEGVPEPEDPADVPITNIRVVSPGYLRTMGIPLVQGRLFTAQDRAGAIPVAVVSKAFAKALWPGQDPLNKRFREYRFLDPNPPWITVVGVVGDVEETGDIAETLYLPYDQTPIMTQSVTLVVRTTVEPMSMLRSVRNQIYRVDKQQPVHEVATAEQLVAETHREQQFSILVAGSFAILGVVLSVMGIGGILSYSVAQQTVDLGVRMALGAQRRDVVKHVLLQGTALGLIGLVIGLTAALVLTRFLANLLYEVSPTDVGTFVVISLGFLAIALLASYLPARKAASLSPVDALRTH